MDFLKYFDKVDMVPFAPVWDVYYYTSRREGKPARANPAGKIKFAEFAFSRAPIFWRNLRGEGGGVVVVVGGRLFKIVKFRGRNSQKNIFGSEMLEKHICQVPVARGENFVEKFFPKDLGNKKVCHNSWPLF